jgi:hypothetical protein
MRKLFLIPLLLLVGCGTPSAPVLSQISPATLTAPTYYENNDTQPFILTGSGFESGASVLVGVTRLQIFEVTATSITVYVPPTLLNAEFPQNPPDQVTIPVQVTNPDGRTSNTVGITVVPHCNPCGT